MSTLIQTATPAARLPEQSLGDHHVKVVAPIIRAKFLQCLSHHNETREGLASVFQADKPRGMVLSLRSLLEILLALPIWYIYVKDTDRSARLGQLPHRAIEDFCGLFHNQLWHDMFQLFNPQLRTIEQYGVNFIPDDIKKIMSKAIDGKMFDYIFIATSCFDRAGGYDMKLGGVRLPGAYVFGFSKQENCVVVLGRFSTACEQKQFANLVSETLLYLYSIQGRLRKLDYQYRPYWFQINGCDIFNGDCFGEYLIKIVHGFLANFERGCVFKQFHS